MCMAFEKPCRCGNASAGFQFKDNILSPDTVRELYCPSCASDIRFDPECMIVDNGWVIEYDMDVARFLGRQAVGLSLTPAGIFDGGYCTWNGFYPGDHRDSVRERERITALAKTAPEQYLREIKTWATQRVNRLRQEGWRKAHEGAREGR